VNWGEKKYHAHLLDQVYDKRNEVEKIKHALLGSRFEATQRGAKYGTERT